MLYSVRVGSRQAAPKINLFGSAMLCCYLLWSGDKICYFHLTFVIYLWSALYHKFKCNFKLILLSTEDGRWATETCLVNLISNVSSFFFIKIAVSLLLSRSLGNPMIVASTYREWLK